MTLFTMAVLWTSMLNLVHILILFVWKFALIFCSHLYLRIPSGVIPSSLSTKILYVFHHPCSWYLSAHHCDWSLFEYLMKSTNYQASRYAVFFVSFNRLGPIILSILFSHINRLFSFHTVWNCISHMYKIKDTQRNIKVSKMNGGKHPWKLICCYFLCKCEFDFLPLFPSIWTLSLFKDSIKCLYVKIFSWIFVTGHEHTSTRLCAYSFSAFRPAFLHRLPAISWVLQAELQVWEI
jgi:hypothetical protein